jgi:tRNA-uridine 2-sulfurtransferase
VRAEEHGGLVLELAEEQRGVAPGQSAVLYESDPERGDRVLGQGRIEAAGDRVEAVRH